MPRRLGVALVQPRQSYKGVQRQAERVGLGPSVGLGRNAEEKGRRVSGNSTSAFLSPVSVNVLNFTSVLPTVSVPEEKILGSLVMSPGRDIELNPLPTPESTSLISNDHHDDEQTSPTQPLSILTCLSSTVRKATIVAAVLVILQFSLLAIFVSYLWSRRVAQNSGMIWVAISNNLLLLMSTIISRVPPIVVPFVMSIAAYGFAREWLTSSPLPDTRGSPTPEQYQIALQVNGSADLGAAWAAIKYLYRRSSNGPRHPNWLSKSITALFILISLAYLIGGVDIWLHQAVFAGRMTSFTTSPTPQTMFSRILDQRFCSSPEIITNHSSCAFNPLTAASYADEGLATATNKSRIHQVALLPNTTIALLLPVHSIRNQRFYEASTFATYTTCASMSRECNLRRGLIVYGEESFAYSCLERPAFSGVFDAGQRSNSAETSRIFGLTEGGQGTVSAEDYDVGAWKQPVELGIFASLPYNLSRNQADPQLVPTRAGSYTVLLWCEMAILNVTYRHDPFRGNSAIQVLNHTLANPRDTFVISGPIFRGSSRCASCYHLSCSFLTGLGANIIYSSALSSALDDLQTWTHAYAAQVSRVALALAAGVVVPAKTLVDYPANPPLPVSKVPFLPAIAFIVVNTLFSICVLLICLRTDTQGPILKDWEGRDVSAIKLTQMRLTSPAALIYDMFCTDTGHKKSGCDEADSLLALDAAEEVRIHVGVLEKRTEQDEPGVCRFGMTTEDLTQPLDDVQGTTVM